MSDDAHSLQSSASHAPAGVPGIVRFTCLRSAPFQAPGPEFAKAAEAMNDYWLHQLQPRLTAVSTRGHPILEENAERADAVIEAIGGVASNVRAEAAKPGQSSESW